MKPTVIDVTPSDLSPAERTKWSKLRVVVKSGIESFRELGSALIEIRDSRLYRDDYQTFEDYLAKECGIGRTRGYALMGATVTNRLVSEISDIPNESVAREFGGLTDEQKIELAKALSATGEKVTAKLARKLATKISPAKAAIAKKRKEREEARLAKRAEAERRKREKKEAKLLAKEKREQEAEAKRAEKEAKELAKENAKSKTPKARGGLGATAKEAGTKAGSAKPVGKVLPSEAVENWYSENRRKLNEYPAASPDSMVRSICKVLRDLEA